MTIIVFDGKTIAADGGETVNHIRNRTDKKKLEIINGVCIGVSGDAHAGATFRHWWRNGKVGYPGGTESFSALVVYANGRCETYRDGYPEPLPSGATEAVGCGFPIAKAALAMGADAKRAVELACELDTECFGDIQVVTLDELRTANDAFMDSVASKIGYIPSPGAGVWNGDIPTLTDVTKK